MAKRFAICVRNDGCGGTLDLRKVYRVFEDAASEEKGFVRVVDESGEDYLYPSDYFVPIEVPGAAQTALEAAEKRPG
jgi:hypothetical protein